MELTCGDWRLELLPERGGAIARLDWRGDALLRPLCGPGVLDTASFPLVPFSNRIAHGRFVADGQEVVLAPNMPGADHLHPLHGFGWLAPWQVAERTEDRVALVHDYPGGEWPWPYRAEQHFRLGAEHAKLGLSVTNLGESAMPAGLGFHPYFPRTPQAIYRAMHRGEWRTTEDCLPVGVTGDGGPRDWWNGAPVGNRVVDTAYEGREGPLDIVWPERGLALRLEPSDNLPVTVVYTPDNADYFCVEPVSHASDAINRGGMTMLAPGETMTVTLSLTPRRLPGG